LMRGEAGSDLTPATPEAKSGRPRKNE
ncbi:glycoprotein, partial [Salmonella enterica subsp. enterica serovar Tennessee]|nr:glycoprotein [Salmonella enterica]EBJ0871104.1 glycoprotein [Salmonella enterica]EBW9351690.1 glycoprotein [Salmonella enterica subsp. enterica serovar Tennessee]ECL3921803.1 glycoprotein [Salmonella enterica]ECU0330882.1 glycoprotein [Salmonella enterica subsp. enterica serovar Tennessee]